MKKETLEEAAEKYAIRSFDSLLKDVDDHFIAGAKWQQERMYSEEDLKIAFDAGESFGSLPFSSMSTSNRLSKEEWFEQFKKK